MNKLKKTALSAALACALAATPLAGAMASDTKSELPPHLQAMGVTQATDADLAEVRGEIAPIVWVVGGAIFWHYWGDDWWDQADAWVKDGLTFHNHLTGYHQGW